MNFGIKIKYRLITIRKIFQSFLKSITTNSIAYSEKTFSQTGEDMIIEEIFEIKQVTSPFFVDIGAYHPWQLNNTARLYLNGHTGINIEANHVQYQKFTKHRPKDINLNIGVADTSSNSRYFMFNNPSFNTFSEDEAKFRERDDNFKIVEIKKVEMQPINYILESNHVEKIDLLSIDIEGLDFKVIKSLNFIKYNPSIICIETPRDLKEKDDLFNFLTVKNYFIYAVTSYNTIFVNDKFWQH